MNKNNFLDIEIKTINEKVQIPEYKSDFAAGVDLTAFIEKDLILNPQSKAKLIPTGIMINMKNPYICGLIFPRSGLGHKKGLVLGNSTGVIDSDYQGQIMVSLVNRGNEDIIIKPYDRIAQLVFLPIIKANFIKVDNFSNLTNRGEKGFGSTGI